MPNVLLDLERRQGFDVGGDADSEMARCHPSREEGCVDYLSAFGLELRGLGLGLGVQVIVRTIVRAGTWCWSWN